MFLIILFFIAVLFSPGHVMAEDLGSTSPSITISPSVTVPSGDNVSVSFASLPTVVTKSSEFTATINISAGKPDTDYLTKFCNTESSHIIEVKVSDSSWKNCFYWEGMPSVHTDSSGNASKSLTLRTTDVGSYNVIARIQFNSKSFDSNPQNLVINQPPTNTPTGTLTGTPSPTNTPSSASGTPTPTKKPTSPPTPTYEPTPTYIPEATPTGGYFLESPTPAPTDSPSGEVLSETSDTTSTPPKSKNLSSILPFAFIGLGGILMSSPLWLPRLAKLIKKKTP